MSLIDAFGDALEGCGGFALVASGTLEADGSLVPHPEWIPSGDQGRIVDGTLRVFGRHDEVVKVAGERFSLVEIEEALLPRPFWPRRVDWAPEWPHLTNGKTDRERLKDLTTTERLQALWPARP